MEYSRKWLLRVTTMWLNIQKTSSHQRDRQVLRDDVNSIKHLIHFTMKRLAENKLVFQDLQITSTECEFKTSILSYSNIHHLYFEF